MDPWKEIENIETNIKNPAEIVGELFFGIKKYTTSKVDFKLQAVNFFPEEVITIEKTAISNISFALNTHETLPHPEFGYNPDKSNKLFRFRVLLYPTSDSKYRL